MPRRCPASWSCWWARTLVPDRIAPPSPSSSQHNSVSSLSSPPSLPPCLPSLLLAVDQAWRSFAAGCWSQELDRLWHDSQARATLLWRLCLQVPVLINDLWLKGGVLLVWQCCAVLIFFVIIKSDSCQNLFIGYFRMKQSPRNTSWSLRADQTHLFASVTQVKSGSSTCLGDSGIRFRISCTIRFLCKGNGFPFSNSS